jgi:hypothetical protein
MSPLGIVTVTLWSIELPVVVCNVEVKDTFTSASTE